jgi:hypothetical protein
MRQSPPHDVTSAFGKFGCKVNFERKMRACVQPATPVDFIVRIKQKKETTGAC